ncbi:M42 family metallopeptidase [Clostridium folliculivorans]|uniref:Glutamyl aminopeptidase n=1 Tax=Clostridium folliculivorans TaxID=2886038 RepID=A0A9W5Y5X9_9CLOT|nr:M42 family metallopeptidase [Clostridium folliculivorans]GKU27154.1 glutamyl aminopeptidase [Clostridium folliculivorans]GKU31771.1 glutamyl aminopeptidase [Clostridium folliculivorans]
MKLDLDSLKTYLISLLTTSSPTGYTDNIRKYVITELEKLKVNYIVTNKGAILVSFEGEDKSFDRVFSGHIDTLGAMVKEIKNNGALELTPVGGFMMTSIDGENCTIETLDGNSYTGTIQTIKPSVHISGDDARDLKRIAPNMEVIIDEKVFSKEDTEKLGINIGDFICFDSRATITEKGFVKSRHLDDKASVAVLLTAIKYISEENIKLPCNTHFFISTYEEVGHGAKAGLPENTKEFIAVDMGAPGPGQNSSEYAVCICAKDSSGPYDYDLRKKIINLCKENNINYKIDIYPHYGSDASAAVNAGWDIRTALIGPGVFASHAYERTHLDSLVETLKLVLKYSQTK